MPLSQRLHLGWVIIGNAFLGKALQPEIIVVLKTPILPNGRASHFVPYESAILVKECSSDIFERLQCDEKTCLLIEDKKFLRIMDSSFHRSSDGFLEAPLPFRISRQPLPENRSMALRRAKSFNSNLCSNVVKQKQVIDFVEKFLPERKGSHYHGRSTHVLKCLKNNVLICDFMALE